MKKIYLVEVKTPKEKDKYLDRIYQNSKVHCAPYDYKDNQYPVILAEIPEQDYSHSISLLENDLRYAEGRLLDDLTEVATESYKQRINDLKNSISILKLLNKK